MAWEDDALNWEALVDETAPNTILGSAARRGLALLKRNEKLADALRPFAATDYHIGDEHSPADEAVSLSWVNPDGETIGHVITVGEFRATRRALLGYDPLA